jgi:DNA-binding GntR family transcriptional regulator
MASPSQPDLRIERPNELIREKVVHVIRQAILDGALAPGRRLTERELIELTGVSRTSIREALRHLQSRGLVESSPGQGLRVAVLTKEEVEHIYDVRAALEPAAVELFVKHASDDEVRALSEISAVLESDARVQGARKLEERLKANQRFDEVLLTGCRNPIMQEMLGSLHTRIHALRRILMTMPDRHIAGRKEHGELMKAIRRRSPEQAASASRRHVLAAKKAALWALSQQDLESR